MNTSLPLNAHPKHQSLKGMKSTLPLSLRSCKIDYFIAYNLVGDVTAGIKKEIHKILNFETLILAVVDVIPCQAQDLSIRM